MDKDYTFYKVDLGKSGQPWLHRNDLELQHAVQTAKFDMRETTIYLDDTPVVVICPYDDWVELVDAHGGYTPEEQRRRRGPRES